MRIGRDQLCYLALMALEDVADECRDGPVKRSLWLRFLLAWLHHESGGDPGQKWIFTSFWFAATNPAAGGNDFLNGYERRTALQAALTAITRLLGWERTVSFEHDMQERRRRFAGSGERE